jgi:hypothetical protein
MTRSHCRLIPVVVVLAAILLATPAFSSPPPAQSWLPRGFALESAWQPLIELWRSLTGWWSGGLVHARPASGRAHAPVRIQIGPGGDPLGLSHVRPKIGPGIDPYGQPQIQPDLGPGPDPLG